MTRKMTRKVTRKVTRKAGVSESKISGEIKKLRTDLEILKREGGRKNGHWVIKEH